jgi:hypothetical protein
MALLPFQRKRMLWIFNTHKNPLPSAGFEPATLGSMASMLTTERDIFSNKGLEVLFALL